MRTLRSLLPVVGLLLAKAACAFGDTGHLAVGELADRLLAGTATGEIVRKVGAGSLRTGAIWADCLRAVDAKTHKYDPQKQYSATCRTAFGNDWSIAAMEGYVRRHPRHKAYHYVNLPYQLEGYGKAPVETGGLDVVTAINGAVARLRRQPVAAPFSLLTEREALRLLAHLVGDIHQPLHVANVFLDPATGRVLDAAHDSMGEANATSGGNALVTVDGALHTFWDALPAWGGITEERMAAARAVAAPQEPLEKWAELWAAEALAHGKTAFAALVFSPMAAPDQHSTHAHYHVVALPPGYAQLRDRINQQQVVLAGARLAHILRRIYDPAP